jgi:hypothetical protein
MNSMIENFINGNLTDAKKQAKRFNLFRIVETLREEFGFSAHKSLKTAEYLKGYGSFQAACDAA